MTLYNANRLGNHAFRTSSIRRALNWAPTKPWSDADGRCDSLALRAETPETMLPKLADIQRLKAIGKL
jgi:hypothetical protein